MNYAARLNRLRQLLTDLPCEALLIEHPTHLFYLTGLELSVGKLLVSQQEACLVVDGRYFERSNQQSLYPVQLLKEDTVKEWLLNYQIHSLGFDKQHTSYQNFLNLSHLATELNVKAHALEILPLDSVVQQLRLIKDANEIAYLRASGHLAHQGYEYVLSLLREGITESELAFELEFFWKKRGASRTAFDSIIAFGASSSMPHYQTGKVELKKNTAVLIDIGVVLSHYYSDMTRVHFFGNPPAEIQTIYPIVEEAKNRTLALCRPGTLIGELDRVAREWIASQGYGEYFTHSLGHGVGLDIHETPIIRMNNPYSQMPVQAGMVFTIEPGIYLPTIGGVRLEDTILITETGYENLTRAET